ncbi:MAG: hypothetical protein DHS20C12_24590 [Pseudohongiella sp.]|nr:MAG: hypothetical protein DHS20C12_24590 [Pseudohongiella sp.]
MSEVAADRSSAAEFVSESEVEGVAIVFVVSSAMDGRGTRPGMAESNGKDNSHSLDLALILKPAKLRHYPTAIEDAVSKLYTNEESYLAMPPLRQSV